ncbi:hypothetical protein ANN_18717 [Periplaneta americana]|uniref:Uncharacterized protein n=1 Tax=Periplaneta americana TaxID=6978 RepID=A0ABQ8SPI3_PERAM|nr:hypothetical protein ANN_18717 [Periplaneta americana]
MDLREVGYDGRDWINLAQDRDQWRLMRFSNEPLAIKAMTLDNCEWNASSSHILEPTAHDDVTTCCRSSRDGPGALIPIKRMMNSDKYIYLLETRIVPQLQKSFLDGRGVFQQDLAPCHTSPKLQNFQQEEYSALITAANANINKLNNYKIKLFALTTGAVKSTPADAMRLNTDPTNNNKMKTSTTPTRKCYDCQTLNGQKRTSLPQSLKLIVFSLEKVLSATYQDGSVNFILIFSSNDMKEEVELVLKEMKNRNVREVDGIPKESVKCLGEDKKEISSLCNEIYEKE